MAFGLVNRNGKIRLPTDPHRLTKHQNIATVDYVSKPYSYPEFGANLPVGGFGQIYEINHFYGAMLCISGTSHGPVSVYPSVTSRSSNKTAKRRITQTTPHDSSGTLVF